MVVCNFSFFLHLMSLLKAVIFWLEFTLSFKRTSLRELEILAKPNLDLKEKIGKVVFK